MLTAIKSICPCAHPNLVILFLQGADELHHVRMVARLHQEANLAQVVLLVSAQNQMVSMQSTTGNNRERMSALLLLVDEDLDGHHRCLLNAHVLGEEHLGKATKGNRQTHKKK